MYRRDRRNKKGYRWNPGVLPHWISTVIEQGPSSCHTLIDCVGGGSCSPTDSAGTTPGAFILTSPLHRRGHPTVTDRLTVLAAVTVSSWGSTTGEESCLDQVIGNIGNEWGYSTEVLVEEQPKGDDSLYSSWWHTDLVNSVTTFSLYL